MFLLAAVASYLIFRKWNGWRHAIFRKRRKWLGQE
jgi:hypothetical protein